MSKRRKVIGVTTIDSALRNLSRAENAAALMLASKIVCGQLEVLIRFAAASNRMRDARRFSKMSNEIADLTYALAARPAPANATRRKGEING
jgi:hypothetical protein